MYCYGDLSGMKKIKARSCKLLNADQSLRLMALFKVFRTHFPKQIQYHFGPRPDAEEAVPDGGDIVSPVSDAELDGTFEGEDDLNEDVPPELAFTRQLAEEIAENTYNDSDCNMSQLQKNLISLIIGQKSVEMHMLAQLASMDADRFRNHYDNIFNGDCIVELEHIDIVEAGELIRRSRKIQLAFREAQEFENNFVKVKSKIPKTFFHRKAVHISTKMKAMTFVMH